MNDPVLCYVDDNILYFTTQALKDQRADDWNDKPYEHNAGTPYTPCWHNDPRYRYVSEHRGINPATKEPLAVGELCRCKSCLRDWDEHGAPRYEIVTIAIEPHSWSAPCDRGNQSFSVDEINAGHTPWLIHNSWESKGPAAKIDAGTELNEVIRTLCAFGTPVYISDKSLKHISTDVLFTVLPNLHFWL